MLLSRLKTLDSPKPVFLSAGESLFWKVEKDALGVFRILALFQLEGCIKAEFLATALDCIQQRHPKLRAQIVQEADGRHSYQVQDPAPSIPFRIVDYDGQEAPWREEARRLSECDFPTAGPFAAVSILRSVPRSRSELILSIHHAISDGLSAIMLVDELLTEYARAESCEERPFSPALPVISGSRARFSEGIRVNKLIKRIVGNQKEEKRSRVIPLPEAAQIPPLSQWMHWVFSREETRKLILRCRKERASMEGVLVAAACCGFIDCTPALDGVFKCQFPLNMRESVKGPFGSVKPEDLGCFVSVVNSFYQVSKTSAFWDIARGQHQDVRAFTKNGGPSFHYNLLALTTAMGRRFPKATRKAIPSGHRTTLLATTYGAVNIRDAYGSLRPVGATLVFKSEEIGPGLIIEGLILGQRLNIGFAADSLEPAFWEKLNVAVRRRLDVAMEG